MFFFEEKTIAFCTHHFLMSAGLHVDTINLDDKRVAKQERPDSKVERKKREQERERDDFTTSCLFSADKRKRNNCKDRKTM